MRTLGARIHEERTFEVKIAAGSRWRSAVDATEVVVVRAPDGEASLECGGHEMLAPGAEGGTNGSIAPEFGGGSQLGKRYCDEEAGLEVLCVKAGDGSLALGGRVLQLKEAKPLPSSD
jgi:hypothetical protein